MRPTFLSIRKQRYYGVNLSLHNAAYLYIKCSIVLSKDFNSLKDEGCKAFAIFTPLFLHKIKIEFLKDLQSSLCEELGILFTFTMSNKSYFSNCEILPRMICHKPDRNGRRGDYYYLGFSWGLSDYKKGRDATM